MKDFKLENETKIPSGLQQPDDAFFDTFSKNILSQLSNEDKKVISLWEKSKKWLYATAAVIIVSSGIGLFLNNQNETNTISIEEYLTYESDLTINDFAQQLSDEDIQSLENEMNLYDTTTENYINDYLN